MSTSDPDTLAGDLPRLTLRKRGYSDHALRRKSVSGSWKSKSLASLDDDSDEVAQIRVFQRFYSLEESGELDVATRECLLSPHCGVPDPTGIQTLAAMPGGWATSTLSYSIVVSQAPFLLTEIEPVISTALKRWSDASSLRFSRVATNGDLKFGFASGDHGDGFSFAANDAELAHAFAPAFKPKKLAGQIHFDLSERWSITNDCPPDSKDLLTVAIHEAGHALGLDHVPLRTSVMFSNYQDVMRELSEFDRQSIRALYP